VGFYDLAHNSNYTRGWTWAASLLPRLSSVGRRCNACGRGPFFAGGYPSLPLGIGVEGGTKYPDVLGCGSYPLLIVSQAMVDDWRGGGVTGYELFPVTVVAAKGPRIREQGPPPYYHVRVTGRCRLDLKAMGMRVTSTCRACGSREYVPVVARGCVIDERTWDGSDLFVSDLSPAITFCTQKVYDLASLNRRTNVRLVPPERCGDPGYRGMDYLGKERTRPLTDP
jgi:hypothetical protein